METARDLASAALWQQSLERSLARRGKSTRGSLELYRLRPERDLVYGDFIHESATYSQLRRSATKRPSMVLPSAGGISALALLAATTLPSLLGGRGGAGSRHEQLTYRADASVARLRGSGGARSRQSAAGHYSSSPQLASSANAGSIDSIGAAPSKTNPAAAAYATALASSWSSSSLIGASESPTQRHPALAHDASAASDTSGGVVAHAVSGGAAPPSPTISAAAPRVPVIPRPPGHPSTGGATARARSAIAGIQPASTAPTDAVAVRTHTHAGAPSHPQPRPTVVRLHRPTHSSTTVGHLHPVTLHKPKPVALPKPRPTVVRLHRPTHLSTTVGHLHPVTLHKPKPVPAPHPGAAPKPKPIARPKPVATTKPAAPRPTAPPPVPVGRYVNPLAGASVTPERIDQGVDYAGSGTLSAIGDGRVTYVGLSGTGWPGAFVEYQLTDGPDSGRYVYYAEGVSPAGGVHVGETLHAGQPVAEIVPGSPTGIEIGWGSGVGTQTLAEARGDWSGGDDADSVPSPEGKDFSALIASLGGPPGKVEG